MRKVELLDILRASPRGWYLFNGNIRLAITREIWLCPVTYACYATTGILLGAGRWDSAAKEIGVWEDRGWGGSMGVRQNQGPAAFFRWAGVARRTVRGVRFN